MAFTLDNLDDGVKISQLPVSSLSELAADIRREILETVSRQGGHLASNLGIVELVVALHAVFDFPKDKLFFDTGHQCYSHKLLTGRREVFGRLRAMDGCCGFPLRSESEYDAYGAGHSGTAISAALGAAAARDIRGGKENIIAVVGDGAIGNGSSLEGINNIAVTTKRFLLVLNDNKMSIAQNVGAISNFLNHIISGKRYNDLKSAIRDFIKSIPHVGTNMKKNASRMDAALKSIILDNNVNLLSDLGLKYVGPVDGHDIKSLVELLNRVKRLDQPVILHVLTKKGRGYGPAERHPALYHGVPAFNLEDGTLKKPAPAVTFSSAFGNKLCAMREKDDRIVAITAGMPGGTGLSSFSQKYPGSFFDTGIAEGHAALFAAGLAASGMKPVFAVYASFSQRTFDQAFHDVFLQKLPVLFCLDRAGIVVDGPTHHGIQGIGCWRMMPNMTIMQPADCQELEMMLEGGLNEWAPAIIRYPSSDACMLMDSHSRLEYGRAELVRRGESKIAIWSVGRELATALKVASLLEARGIDATVVNARFVIPFDKKLMLEQFSAGFCVFIIEDHLSDGGFGSIVRDEIPEYASSIVKFGWPVSGVSYGNTSELRKSLGMDAESIAAEIERHYSCLH